MTHKTKRPADAATSAGPRVDQRLVRTTITPTNSLKSAGPQATPLPDDRGEDDWTYFRRRPGAVTRLRLPFEDEYPACVLLPGRPAFVRIQVERDANGRLKRCRSLRFCKGGSA